MSDGKKSNDPGPGAPPPGMGFESSVVAGGETVVADDVVKKQVDEIKKSAMLRLTLAGSRSMPTRATGNGIPSNMTPAQYAHQYRGGDQLPLATPDFFGGFVQPPANQQHTQHQFQSQYQNPQHGRPTWPPPPPPDYQNQLRVSEQPIGDYTNNTNTYSALVNTPQRARGDFIPHPENGAAGPNSSAVNWRRVVHRDTEGEVVETVRWIREEILM